MMFHQIIFCLIIIFCVRYTHATSGYRERDPCRVVCEEYSASRRGDGEFLCDTGSSTCVRSPWGDAHYCLHLYWGASDDGLPGLIYEENEGQITQDELENYLTCRQALEIVGNRVTQPAPAQTDSSHAHAMMQIMYSLRPVERIIGLLGNRSDRISATQHWERSSLIRQGLNRPGSQSMSYEVPPTPYDILETRLQSLEDPMRAIFEHQSALRSRCELCRVQINALNPLGPMYRRSVRLSPYLNEVDMTTAFHESFTPQNESWPLCLTCATSNMISTGAILTTLPEIFPIEFRRQLYHFGPYMNTRVIFPQTLDLSSIPGVAELNISTTHYTLVALTHSYANGSHSAELVYNQTWYRVDTLGEIHHLGEPTIGSSSTVSLLLYQRDDIE
jgi:hypothetical protein